MEDEIYLVVKDIELPHFSTDFLGDLEKFYNISTDNVPDRVYNYNKSCWALIDNRAGYIFDNSSGFGIVDSDDSDYYLDDTLWVRPVLIIDKLDELDLRLYTELEIFDENWFYIRNNRCFSVKAIKRIPFDYNDNYNYEHSDIKLELLEWLKAQKAKFDED